MIEKRITDKIDGYIKNGISLLNEKQKGWFEKVNLRKLNIFDSNNCILGQIFKDVLYRKHYTPFLHACIFLHISRPHQYGFVIDLCLPYPHRHWKTYYNKKWREEIKKLKQAKKAL